jgi:hypothetical protein
MGEGVHKEEVRWLISLPIGGFRGWISVGHRETPWQKKIISIFYNL